MLSNKQNKPQPSPADLISKAEADISRLENEREAHVARGVELAERRKAASYGAHVQHDPESRKQLDAVNAEMATHASELASFDDALVEARAKLVEAQQAQAREEERAHIIEQRRMNEEVRKLGPLARSRGGRLRRRPAWPDERCRVWDCLTQRTVNEVLMLYRCLLVALRGTPWEREFGVADSNDKKNFSRCTPPLLDQWCDANERDFKYRLAALDGHDRVNATEAA